MYVATPAEDNQTNIEPITEEWLEQQRKNPTVD
jgi:hypothetical protein